MTEPTQSTSLEPMASQPMSTELYTSINMGAALCVVAQQVRPDGSRSTIVTLPAELGDSAANTAIAYSDSQETVWISSGVVQPI